MEILSRFRRLCHVETRGLLGLIILVVGFVLLLLQSLVLPYSRTSSPRPPDKVLAATSADEFFVKDGNEYSEEYREDEERDYSSLLYGVKNDSGISNNEQKPYFSVAVGPNLMSGSPNKAMESSDENSSRSSVVLTSKFTRSVDVTSLKPGNVEVISLSEMNSMLVHSFSSSHPPGPKRSSACDNELLSAKYEIENAPFVRDIPGIDASVFRNISKFQRSYELMERKLKVYVYKEGEKPIFHKPKLRGIYASEGWFMKLMEANKKFVVRSPKKAHLFYMPISIKMLRVTLAQDLRISKNLSAWKNLTDFVKKYVDLIGGKYKYWNRTGGADHFLVACHDWGGKLTRNHMKNTIRALCNSNVAQGFRIGKDTTLPVTNIRSAETPLEYLGGKPPLERETLAFFAGSNHGYLRPFLLHYWENTEPDMKIIGPMPRDPEGKKKYRDYMKDSRYCVCARGYEVHTPRIVEAISYGCVPVIISDNYVPPFFEMLDWEAFSVFVEEKEIQNLRMILLAIPEERYLMMQARVKMVQQHFLWHKKPVKYDLFHMILHSIWYIRVFNVKPKI